MQFDSVHLIIHNLPSAPYMESLYHLSAFYFEIALYFSYSPCKFTIHQQCAKELYMIELIQDYDEAVLNTPVEN